MYSAQRNLIVAIDRPDLCGAIELAKKLKGQVFAVKLGLEFFMVNGACGVREIRNLGIEIFLDLKFHDIPNTVSGAIREVVKLGVKMITIHSSGGGDMMENAVSSAHNIALKGNIDKPMLLGVTILTSLDQKDILEIGYQQNLEGQVVKLARLAARNGLDGIVCSAYEIANIKNNFPNLKLIVPGIRFKSDDVSDQKRVMTPDKALELGADYLVMGRSFTNSCDILEKIEEFNNLVSKV